MLADVCLVKGKIQMEVCGYDIVRELRTTNNWEYISGQTYKNVLEILI